jgi:hypothetical protein
MLCCGVVCCGVVWCGVVWCGVVWCGVVWCGVVWCGVVWCGVVWCVEWSVYCCVRKFCKQKEIKQIKDTILAPWLLLTCIGPPRPSACGFEASVSCIVYMDVMLLAVRDNHFLITRHPPSCVCCCVLHVACHSLCLCIVYKFYNACSKKSLRDLS